ncbi:hypothetical protein KAX08_02105 [candidate division WOR-3 bacterium]|nr:hypothetical protein [candidate division WOR-3 bacterium]
MFLLLLSITTQFLVITVDSPDGEKVTINAPKKFVESAILYAKEREEGCFKINDEEISPDSILVLLNQAEVNDEPILEVEKDGEIIKFWIRKAEDILDKTGRPRRLIIEVYEKDESPVRIRLPLWVVRIIPAFVIAIGENADEIRMAKRLIKDAISEVRKMDGGFTLVEVIGKDERVKIEFD